MTASWPHHVEIAVRWRDLDAFGHVNNAVYLSYLEVARVALWRSRMGGRDARDIPFVVARVEIDYRSAIELGETVRVELACESVGRRSFTLVYRILAGGRLAAEARSVQVCVDRSGATIPVPGALRAVLEQVAGPPAAR